MMETIINEGKTGAKRQSWRGTNPRSILLKLIADNPHETRQDEDRILELFWQAIRKDEDILHTIAVKYWGTNNYSYLVYRRPDSTSRVKKTEEVEAAKNSILSKIILLDFVMPNGKPLRECTKQDCQKIGGWLLKVAKTLKPKQMVGEVFSERELRRLANAG
jgi:hypothetical protein